MQQQGMPAGSVRYMATAPQQASVRDPYIEIVEQPKARDMRFRYECEGRTAGSIPGANSTKDNKTFPAIRVKNYAGAAVFVVSCVSKNPPYYPHPHSLVGKTNEYECKHGVCTYKVKDASQVTQFSNLGIQCVKRKQLAAALQERQKIRVDPFRTGHPANDKEVDLNAVRLCWQVFLPDANGKFTRIVQPVVSAVIYDKKSVNDLVICRIDRISGSAMGNEEVFLLCEKVNKDDIEVRFYENDEKGLLCWEAFGSFGPTDVHHQVAIVFKTPPYKDIHLSSDKKVNLQLRRPVTKDASEPMTFVYTPHHKDPDWIDERRKRKRTAADGDYGMDVSAMGATVPSFTADDTRGRVRQMVMERRNNVKAEPACSDVPSTVLGVEQASGHFVPSTSNRGDSQPFVSYSSGAADPPALSSITSSLELPSSLFGLSSQDLMQIMADPMMSDASNTVDMVSLDLGDHMGVGAVPAVAAHETVSSTNSFSTASLGTALDQLRAADAAAAGQPGQVEAPTDAYISTNSFESLMFGQINVAATAAGDGSSQNLPLHPNSFR